MQLLEHFKELTLHPKNAEELKALILQLAVQGKLTQKWREENQDVEPASVLLKKLEIEKKKLIQIKQIRKEQPLEAIEEDTISAIPPSWELIRLGEIGDWGAGATPSRSRSDFYGGNINWFKSGELNNGIIDYNSEETINELALKNSSLRLNKVGDVLIAMYGATIGKTGILAVEGTTNQAVCACTPFSCISNVYLHLLLKALKGKFINQGEGGAQPNISRVKIRNQVFALPPLAEQKAIVEVVNQLFAEVEQLEALTKERIQLKADFVTSALNQLTQASEQDVASQWEFLKSQFGTFFTEKSNIKKLREAILQLAVQGKLTHHWRTLRQAQRPPIEPAVELLEKIKTEKEQLIKAGKIKKEKPLPPISEEEIPYDLPEGWVWCRFQEIFDIRDGTHDSPKDAFGHDTFPLITSKNFKNGEIDFDSARRISNEDYLKVIQRSQVHKGDILFSMIGGNIGNQVEVGEFTEYAIKNVALFKHYKYGLPAEGFLNLYSKYIALSLQDEAAGGAQPFVSLKYFRNLVLGLPPLEEQKAIVEKVNGLMALCDRLEQEIENHQTTQEQWMQSCLREVV